MIVGNEPNLNRFWMPQFNEDGTGASAPAYLALLAATYDAVKAVDPATRIWGGALAPRGVDRPATGRDTISPTRFVRELGAAYRLTGRTSSGDGRARLPSLRRELEHAGQQSPADPDHIGLADHDRLVRLLGTAFDGTPQAGSTCRSCTTSTGSSRSFLAEKAALYTGAEPATTLPVDEAAQAAGYAKALRIAYCQPNVAGILLFHTADEISLGGWQSGLLYPDQTPKTSLGVVRDTLDAIANGTAGRCSLAVKPVVTFAQRTRRITLRCDRDCVYRARLLRLPAGAITAWRNGRSLAGKRLTLQLGARVRPGRTVSRSPSCTRRGPAPSSFAPARPSWCARPRGADARRLRRQQQQR